MPWKKQRNSATGEIRLVHTETGEVVTDPQMIERADPLRTMNALDVFRAGYGKSYADTHHGTRGLIGQTDPGELAAREQYDAELMSQPAAKVGHFAGLVSQMAGIPATTIPRAAMVGGLFGATRPAETAKEEY